MWNIYEDPGHTSSHNFLGLYLDVFFFTDHYLKWYHVLLACLSTRMSDPWGEHLYSVPQCLCEEQTFVQVIRHHLTLSEQSLQLPQVGSCAWMFSCDPHNYYPTHFKETRLGELQGKKKQTNIQKINSLKDLLRVEEQDFEPRSPGYHIICTLYKWLSFQQNSSRTLAAYVSVTSLCVHTPWECSQGLAVWGLHIVVVIWNQMSCSSLELQCFAQWSSKWCLYLPN